MEAFLQQLHEKYGEGSLKYNYVESQVRKVGKEMALGSRTDGQPKKRTDEYSCIDLATLNMEEPDNAMVRAWGRHFLNGYVAYCRSQARPPHSKASITFTLQGTVKQQFLHTIALEIYTLLDAGQQVSGESNEEAEKARNLATVLAMVFGTYLAGIKELDGGVTTDSGEVLKRSVRANKPRCGYWVEAMEKAEKEYRADGDVEFRSTASTNSSRKAAAGPSTGGSSRSTTPSTARSVPPTDSSSVQTNQKVDDGEDQAGASLKGFAAAMSGLTLGSGKQASSIAPTKQ